MDFNGKKVVVSGGLGGMGYETCSQLLKQGIECLAILDCVNDDYKIQKLKGSVVDLSKNITILYFKIDISNREQVEGAFNEIGRKFKQIDIYIGLAAILNDRKIEETINVNFLGTVYTTLNAMHFMSKSLCKMANGGIIAIVSSLAGIEPFFTVPIYVGSKHAIVGYMRSFSNDYYYNLHGIKYITICPGATDTPMSDNLHTRSLTDELGSLFAAGVAPLQKNLPADIAKFIIDIITIGKNGSVWIVDNKKIKEIEFKQYWP